MSRKAAQLDREIAAALKPRVARGECFSYAYQFVTKQGGVLKHGTVTHPWDKTVFPHKAPQVHELVAARILGSATPVPDHGRHDARHGT